MLRAAGLTPVRTIRAAFRQRYAIAAVPTPAPPLPARRRTRRVSANDSRSERAAAGAGLCRDRCRRRDRGRRDRRRRAGRRGPRGAACGERAGRDRPGTCARAWRWRAGGVFTSPAAVAALRRAGLDATTLAAVARPDPRDAGRDRIGDIVPAHLRRRPAAANRRSGSIGRGSIRSCSSGPSPAGADVRRGWTVTAVDLADGRRGGTRTGGRRRRARARHRRRRRGALGRGAGGGRRRGRSGSTRGSDSRTTCRTPIRRPAADARMRVLRDGYVGIAPVAGGRVNVGIVLGPVVAADPPAGGREGRGRWDRPVDPPDRRRPGGVARRVRRPTRSRAPGRSAIG